MTNELKGSNFVKKIPKQKILLNYNISMLSFSIIFLFLMLLNFMLFK